MKKFILLLITAAVALHIDAQQMTEMEQMNRLSCTSIMVGKKASTDGSVMTSHNCDSWYRTWMQVVPATDQKDSLMEIYTGRMHTDKAGSMTGVEVKGKIPQVAHTYRFLDCAYPCLNEKQLGIGETTISGRDTLVSKEGMFMIEELERVALQRCATAREAIQLMGQLISEYGYIDSGECLTIADPQEVWIFEVFGEGAGRKGGVWAAQRIPDDEVGVSANICRIGQIDLNDKDRFMASENVKDAALRLKLWDGKEPFSFWRAYSGGNYSNEVKNYSTRELFILNTLAPSLGLNNGIEDLPISVKPEKKVSVQDVSRLIGSYYEGTPNDLSGRLKVPNNKKEKVIVDGKETIPDSIVSPLANPWMRSDELALHYAQGDSAMKWIRTISVPQCAYSTIIQLRSWLPDDVGGVAWVCLDNPGESPRYPIFSGTSQLPAMLEICGNHQYREDAALWHFRQANKLATVRWGICRKTLEPARDYFLEKGAREMPFVEKTYKQILQDEGQDKAQAYLTGYTSDYVGAEILKWDELYRAYWRRFWAGF